MLCKGEGSGSAGGGAAVTDPSTGGTKYQSVPTVPAGGNDDDGGEENSGKITGIHRAVEIEWDGTDGAEFALQKSNDLKNWETVESLSGNGETTSVFLRVSGHTQFWRLQPE